MINNAALDVAIGVTLMYLMLSLLCTVVNEFIATQLDLRAKTLATALNQLIDSDVVRNAFYDHGMIAGTKQTLEQASSTLWRAIIPFASKPVAAATPAPAPAAAAAPTSAPADVAGMAATVATADQVQAAAPTDAPAAHTQGGAHPSYISSDTFVQALIGGLTGTRLAAGQPAPTFADIKAAVEKLPESRIKSALVSSITMAGNDIEVFRGNVATWFDDSMERLSGAYRRYMKWISLVVGLVAAVGFNADTFAVTEALWRDPALRQQVVDSAIKAVNNPNGANATSNAPSPATPNPPAASTVSLDELKQSVSSTEESLRPFPIGWTAERRNSWQSWAPTGWPWITILGWIMTGLALSLGAPFWFDVLSKFISIRSTGPKPKRADEAA